MNLFLMLFKMRLCLELCFADFALESLLCVDIYLMLTQRVGAREHLATTFTRVLVSHVTFKMQSKCSLVFENRLTKITLVVGLCVNIPDMTIPVMLLF